MKIISKMLTAAAVALATLAVGAGSGHAALLAKSPVNTPGGYPSWFQDQTGLALQGCLNDPPLPVSFCFLPDGIVEQPGFDPNAPKDFPNNFPIEHFYFLASTPPITLTNGSVATELEFAVEGAFNPEIIDDPNQEMFHRLRLIFSPNIAAGPGTYVVVHPWGTTVIPPALQQEPFGIGGTRGRATIDANIGSATGNLASTNDNFAGVLGNNPLFTISNFITQTTPAPPVGFLGDCATPSTVTGGVNGNIAQILFRPAVGPDVLIGETPLFVVCGQKTGVEVSPASSEFGVWKLNTPSTPITFTATNLTGVDIPARDVLAGEGLIMISDNPAFSIVADDTCADGLTALAPENTCTFGVVFTTAVDGLATGNISISSAGNPNATVTVTGTGDGIPPVLNVAPLPFTNTLNPTISGTVVHDGVAIHDVSVSVNGQMLGVSHATDGNWSAIISGLIPNVANTVTVTASDAAQPAPGNQTIIPVTITHDSIQPLVNLTAPAAGLTNNTTPALAFNVVEINPAADIVKIDGTAVTPTPATLGPLADGPHTVIVESTDAAGNLGSATTTITVDATPPVIAVASPKPINGRLGLASPTLTFSVNDANPNAASTVVRLDGFVVPNPVSGVTTLGPFAAGSVHTLNVSATDAAGNATPISDITFTVVFADGRVVSLGALPVSITDALRVLRHIVNLATMSPDEFAHADVFPLDAQRVPNPDGTVNISDALLILRRVVGLETF